MPRRRMKPSDYWAASTALQFAMGYFATPWAFLPEVNKAAKLKAPPRAKPKASTRKRKG